MQSPQASPAPKLISAQQVQLMLGVDRSTIYRMAEDGRLPAIKVGRQWRFDPERIHALLHGPLARETTNVAPQPALAGTRQEPQAPDREVARSVTQVAAEILGVMMVVTDMDGHPITEVANPCPWFAERSGDSALLQECIGEWQVLADSPDFEPKFATGTLGFQCARAFVRSGASLVAMVLIGGVAPPGSETDGLYHLDESARRTALSALPKVAAVLSRVETREPRLSQLRSHS